MYNFNNKQKIILGILTSIVVGAVCYYVYINQEAEITTQTEVENNLEVR